MRVYVSAIAEFSAIAAWALSFNTLKPNPLKNVREAVPQFDLPILTIAQELNRLQIDKINLGQVENRVGSPAVEQLPKLSD